MLKALIVGCGKIAGGNANELTSHAGAIKKEKRVTLTGCVDIIPEKAEVFSKKYKCEPYSDLNFALEQSNPDFISICTPDLSHFKIAEKILKSKNCPRLIFIEKPVCSDPTEYQKLKKLTSQKDVIIVVNHTRRFNQQFSALKELLHSGEIGSPIRVNATYYSGLFHNGSHIVDTINYLLDDHINWTMVQKALASPYEGDPTLELRGEMNNSGAEVVISAIDETYYQLFEFDFWHKKGRLKIEDFGENFRFHKQVTNEICERVLKEFNLKLPCNEKTEMQVAIFRICNFLEDNNLIHLDNVTLSSFEPTMKMLWQAKDLYFKKTHE
jgi:predicted dehydrogenase